MTTTRLAPRQAEVVSVLPTIAANDGPGQVPMSLTVRLRRAVLTARAVTALVDLTHALRPDWQPAGIRAAIRTCDKHDPYTVALAMLRRAANPANRTPQLQPHDLAAVAVRCAVHPQSGRRPDGRCAGCLVDAATGVGDVPRQPLGDAAWKALLTMTGGRDER